MYVSRPILTLIFAATLAVSSNGASAQINSNRALMDRLDRMENDMGLMQKQLSNTNSARRYKPSTDADAKSITTGNFDADLLQQVFKLEEEVRSLRGEIETNNFELERLKNQLKLMQDDVDFRLKSVESGGQPASTGNEQSQRQPFNDPGEPMIKVDDAYRPPLDSRKPVATSSGSGTLAKPGTNVGDAPRQSYNEAFRLLNQNRYDDSEKAFTDFTTTYPDDPLIGNAYYWLGETHYIRQNYLEAADNFREGYQKLPNGPKAPDNLLKLAITLKELDRTSDACTVIDQIDKKFQDAPSSIISRAKSEKKLMGCQ